MRILPPGARILAISPNNCSGFLMCSSTSDRMIVSNPPFGNGKGVIQVDLHVQVWIPVQGIRPVDPHDVRRMAPVGPEQWRVSAAEIDTTLPAT